MPIRTMTLTLALLTSVMLAGCGTGTDPVTAPPTTAATSDAPGEDPAPEESPVAEYQWDDSWGGTGATWTVAAPACLDVATIEAATGISGLSNTSGGGLDADGCLYADAADTNAVGYYSLPSGLAASQPLPATSLYADSLGPDARTTDQFVFNGMGCLVTVPLTDNAENFLGVTVNTTDPAVTSDGAMCGPAVAVIGSVAEQGTLTPEEYALMTD
jgi:hypothetical protein